jgi:hypothetical protein
MAFFFHGEKVVKGMMENELEKNFCGQFWPEALLPTA